MATIYDVAKSAGVSAKTVSRVLNKDPLVAKATRDSVQSHMAKLGYVPSHAARSMRAARSGLIGLISGGISDVESNPERSGLPAVFIYQGVQHALKAAGKTLLIADTGGDRDSEVDLMRTFAEHRVEAVLYVAPHHQQVTLPDIYGIPEIVIVNGFDAARTPAVVPDDYAGQHDVVSRLIAEGHRRIAYLTLRVEMIATQERTRGYRDALAEAGIAFDPALVTAAQRRGGDLAQDRRQLEDALDQILALPDPPTVICCGNDPIALQLYGRLRTRGIRVPEDMSVVGYDDYRVISETLFPPLTSVELPYRQMGIAAGEWLLSRLKEGASSQTEPVRRVRGGVRWRDSVVPM